MSSPLSQLRLGSEAYYAAIFGQSITLRDLCNASRAQNKMMMMMMVLLYKKLIHLIGIREREANSSLLIGQNNWWRKKEGPPFHGSCIRWKKKSRACSSVCTKAKKERERDEEMANCPNEDFGWS